MTVNQIYTQFVVLDFESLCEPTKKLYFGVYSKMIEPKIGNINVENITGIEGCS